MASLKSQAGSTLDVATTKSNPHSTPVVASAKPDVDSTPDAASSNPGPDALRLLSSTDQASLLDAIDNLRAKGIGKYDISLPQLIVCGNQSSGKSSVLEGLTRLRFPTDHGVCTTFPTELILRKEKDTKIRCTIIPAASRNDTQKKYLSGVERVFTGREDFKFQELIKEVKGYMRTGGNSRVFFEDVLRIQYSGPHIPSLTVVDLPGLIEHQSNGGDSDDCRVVERLVKRYMKDKKSIILAVMVASNHPDTQKVLRYLAEPQIDPEHQRTLGIITKPDRADSAESETIVSLAKNQKKPKLKLGWHVVRNRGPEEGLTTNAERDKAEKDFFATSIWNTLGPNNIGIDSLRERLSKLLTNQIRKELPSLISAVQAAKDRTETELAKYGESRDTPDKQRSFLISKAQDFQRLTLSALNGFYTEPFFLWSPTAEKAKLRTRVTNLHRAFTNAMHLKGHTWHIEGNSHPDQSFIDKADDSDYANYDLFADPEPKTRDHFLGDHIAKHVRENRISAFDLPNPAVISAAFAEQTKNWEAIAMHHLALVDEAVTEYVDVCLETIVPDPRTRMTLRTKHVDPALNRRWEATRQKVEEIWPASGDQDPIMYEPGFQREYRVLREKREEEDEGSVTDGDIFDLMQCYYKRKLSIFIHNVVILVLENCWVSHLPSIMDGREMSALSQDSLAAIAGEALEVREEREGLEAKLRDMVEAEGILVEQRDKGGYLVSSTRASHSRGRRFLPPATTPQPQVPEIEIEVEISSEDNEQR